MPEYPTYPHDDPTEPVPPSAPPPGSGGQGKLIIGSFHDSAGGQPAGRRQPPPGYQGYQTYRGGVYTPPRRPGTEPYPGSYPALATPAARPRRSLLRRRGCAIGCLSLLLVVIVLAGFSISVLQRVLAFGSAISTQAPLSTQTGFMSTSERVNLLVLGFGGGDHPGAYLTDSMVLMSLIPSSQHTTLISIPRDLWVQVPSGSGHYGKINSVYEVASNEGKDPVAGGNAAAQKVSLITGLDVKYWMTIDFEGFRDLINAIGGIDVYVPDSFTALYPKNDDPNIDASWIKVHFSKGMQHMDGETAIRYARARESLDNPAEGTDFARSARQMIIIKAVISKVKQWSTWPHLFDAMDALKHTIYTNMSLTDLGLFSLKMDLNQAHRIGLSNQNVLVDSQSADGQYILLPANNNWQLIIDYIRKNLYN
ncbi:LCP family protein [Thermogemmatispora sp.]|uniref:LCP family protein n=1 Tax=Thermogemmatispora sp. TaxID=1968838 RepID=UPI001D27345B|nr:LCP family protein [Thermogemmatispora sp.]MBX5448999.1 LCP family protein [Thermogemmatispora sp.]